MASNGQRKLGYLDNREEKIIKSFVRKIREEVGDDILDIRLFG